MNSKKSLILSVIGILGLIVITIGVSFAFFNYAKEGTTDNTITTGTITFLYTEVSGVGKGISLIDSYPISDSQGKNLTGEGKIFDFKVTSTNNMNASIPYEITARKKDGSTLDEEAVKIYLTKVSGDNEEEVLLDKYSNLSQTDKVSSTKYNEKTLYTSKVPASIGEYEQAYRLRMWIDEDTDFSPIEDSEGNITYPYNNKEFTITVNVYANAKVIVDSEVDIETNTEIKEISINSQKVNSVDNQEYDYEINLDSSFNSITIDVETVSPTANVNIEKIDNLVYYSNIKRLSVSKNFELNIGENYFKITVTSQNKEIINEYILKVNVLFDCNSLIGSTWDFDYNKKEDEFEVTCGGNYKLETWGAQGGTRSPDAIGGYGAYAVGNVKLSANDILFINIGGAGDDTTGGYNGGANGNQNSEQSGAGGGGATSISTKSGLLSSFATNINDNISNILIIAAGGGGTGYSSDGNYSGVGGAGGGIQGNDGIDPTSWKYYYGTGATQTLGGKSYASLNNVIQSGTFGQGGSGRGDGGGSGGSGGGGGLYGGGGSSRGHGGGGGGSSYIGNPLLINKAMYCYECTISEIEDTKTISVGSTEVSSDPISGYAKIGSGYARITYLGE